MKPVISVIIPVYNEEEVLDAAFTRLQPVMQAIGEPYELLFVNDGSRDRSAQILHELAQEHADEVKVLYFARNFGHQMAVTAGLDAAQGDAIVIIDADLQDPPEVIPQMVEKWREGYDVVYGKRAKREGDGVLKRATAWLYYRILRAMVGMDIPADTGDFRLVSRRAADAVRSMREHNRFLRGMFPWVGFRQTDVTFQRDKRYAGVTKYPVSKMLKLAKDGILSFSFKPLDWITWLGLLLAAAGGIWLIVLLILLLAGRPGPGTLAIGGLLLLLSGLIIGCTGILGAYISRIYDEVRGRPLYIIAERDGFDADMPQQ